jgi:hypothetical protein
MTCGMDTSEGALPPPPPAAPRSSCAKMNAGENAR